MTQPESLMVGFVGGDCIESVGEQSALDFQRLITRSDHVDVREGLLKDVNRVEVERFPVLASAMRRSRR